MTGRLIFTLDHPPVMFEIREYRSSSNEIIVRRLFDQNNIILDPNTQLNYNLRTYNETDFFSRFRMMSEPEA